MGRIREKINESEALVIAAVIVLSVLASAMYLDHKINNMQEVCSGISK